MDQIVFVFDLDQVVPLHGDVGVDQLVQCVKLAVLRIATYCTKTGWISHTRNDLPCFGFRSVLIVFIVLLVILVLNPGFIALQGAFISPHSYHQIGMIYLWTHGVY